MLLNQKAEHIAIHPSEQRRLVWVRNEIIKRDKLCTFPVMQHGELIGLEITAPAPHGEVHHITPISFLQMHRPGTNPNHPVNLITLDGNRHNMMHREWVNRYGAEPFRIKQEVYYGGKAGWVDEYDEALTNIALIRTHDYLQHTLDVSAFYENVADEVSELYENMDKNFEDRYRELEKRYLYQ